MTKIYEHISIEEFLNGLKDGIALNGKLKITSPYLRGNIYSPKQQAAVIEAILDDAPISAMYFSKYKNGKYQLLDGKQRISSIINFANDNLIVTYHDVPRTIEEIKIKSPDLYKNFLSYQIDVVLCDGTASEFEKYFEALNCVGEPLTRQESRNIIYNSAWLEDAKFNFSTADGCAANFCKEYGNIFPQTLRAERQEWLETVIAWKLESEGVQRNEDEICKYMSSCYQKENASDLISYFSEMTDWISRNFKYRPAMQQINWGNLFNKYGDTDLLYLKTDKIIDELIENAKADGITKVNGIYEFVLSGDSRFLSERAFSLEIKKAKWDEQGHKCKSCGNEFAFEDMHGDHIFPWSKGGLTIADNCQLLCADCDTKKSNRLTTEAKFLAKKLRIKGDIVSSNTE